MNTLAIAALQNLLHQEFAGNTVEAWLIALAVLVAGALLLGITKRILVFRLKKLAESTETDLDDLVVDLVDRTSRLFLLSLAIYLAHHWVTLSDNFELFVQGAVKLVLWFQVGLWGRGLVHYGIQRMIRGRAADDPARTMGTSVLGFVGALILWTAVVLLCLENFHVPVNSLIASLGVGGIAVALAAQNILGDLFASISILLDKPFVVGDQIVLGDFAGTVEHIGIKTTRVRSVTGEEIIMGNADLVHSRLRNFKRMSERRSLFTVGVTYDTPSDQVAAIPGMLQSIVASTPNTRFDRAHFKSFGDFALVFEVVFFSTRPEMNALMDTQQEINLKIRRRFEQEGIQMAFPTHTVHLARGGEPPAAAQKELSRG